MVFNLHVKVRSESSLNIEWDHRLIYPFCWSLPLSPPLFELNLQPESNTLRGNWQNHQSTQSRGATASVRVGRMSVPNVTERNLAPIAEVPGRRIVVETSTPMRPNVISEMGPIIAIETEEEEDGGDDYSPLSVE